MSVAYIPVNCTNSFLRTPHYWRSQVRADVRTITSDVFATRYSLRFPRVERLRADKAPRDATSVRELEELVARGGACVEMRGGMHV